MLLKSTYFNEETDSCHCNIIICLLLDCYLHQGLYVANVHLFVDHTKLLNGSQPRLDPFNLLVQLQIKGQIFSLSLTLRGRFFNVFIHFSGCNAWHWIK